MTPQNYFSGVCLVISKKTKFRERETSSASLNIYAYATTTKSRKFSSLYRDFECFSGTETLTCLFGEVFLGGVGRAVCFLFYKQQRGLIQNAYIMNCQSDFLQLFLSDIVCPIWLRRCARCIWYRKSYSLQRAYSISVHHVKTTSVLKYYLSTFLHSSLVEFFQYPRCSHPRYYFFIWIHAR